MTSLPRLQRRAAAVLVLACAFASFSAISHAIAETPLERGAYLVNAIMACDGCHTPRGPGGVFNMEKRFSGGPQTWDTDEYTVKGANISSDRETGIGGWSAEDLKRSLTEGVRPTGVPLSPQMPFPFYKVLTPGDLDAVVAYVSSVEPVRNQVQTPTYKKAMHVGLVPGGEKPMSEESLSDPLKRGFYIATIAHCMECHSKRPDGVEGFKSSWGKGGYVMKEAWGEARVPNITSHQTAGIGAWSDAEIKRALVEGVGRDGRRFKPPMARQVYYKNMTEQDLNALIAWVRTIPPLE